MGFGPFATANLPNGVDGGVTAIHLDAKLPNDAHTKLPKQRLSAEERLRRLEEAMAFLRQHLVAGPQPTRDLLKAAKAAGIAEYAASGQRCVSRDDRTGRWVRSTWSMDMVSTHRHTTPQCLLYV